MTVCSVVSNFAIPWTVAPPQTAAHGFSVHVIPQARILEWVAVSYSRGLLVTLHELRLAKLLQSCLTLCDPTDGSPPGSPVPGILQARTLEWVAISFSSA